MSSRARWLGLLFISIAVSLIIVDSTIVNVAIPSIVGDLGINATEVQWVQEGYTLVFAALLILFGTLADRIGRRRMLIAGVALFTLASVFAGLADSAALLIAARVLQGVGGAMILPATMSLINTMFRGRERGIAFAIWGSTIGGMAAVGPLLGGWLTTDFSWRWAFGVNVPFGILVIVGVLFTIAESRSDDEKGFDVVGAALSTIAAGSLVFALIQGRTMGWWLTDEGSFSVIPLVLLLSVVAIGAFVAWQRYRTRVGRSTMIPLDLFAIQSFRNGNIVALIVSLGELGLLFVLPMWLQNVLLYSALQAGQLLLALAIGSFLASGAISGLSRRMSAIAILRTGIVLEIAALVALGFTLRADSGWLGLAVVLFVYGLGLGLASAQVTNVVLADVPLELSGRASGTQSTSRQIGSALGIAVLGTTLFTSLSIHLDSQLADLAAGRRDGLVSAVTESAGAAIPGLLNDPSTAEIGRLAAESFTEAATVSAFLAAGFLVIALFVSLSLGRQRAEARTAS